jgi:dihydrofolate reductase
VRKLVVTTSLTLDGVMQAPGTPEEDPTGGFTLGGWSVNYWDSTMERIMTAAFATPFDLLLGRKTYEIFAAHWPYSDEPAAAPLNQATKYVATTTLQEPTWQNTTLLQGDVPAQVSELKQQDGPEIQVHGSANLIQTLLRHDLVDEFRLWTFPLVVGLGKRLFGDGTVPAAFAIADVVTSTSGVVMATYQRAGSVEPGSFALEQPTEAELQRRERLASEG